MKRKLLIMFLAAAFVLGACGGQAADSGKDASSEAASSNVSESASGSDASSEDTPTPDEASESDSDNAVGDILLDDAPVSEENFDAEKYSDFISLAAYDEFSPYAPDGTRVENGMTVNIDYTGYADLDGDGEVEPFDGGATKGNGEPLKIGSHSYIDDFEEQLIGHVKGDEVEVNVTFPEDYGSEELSGKDARFDVTINEIVKETADDYFSKVCNNSTTLAYPADIWNEIVDYFNHYAEKNSMTTEELFSQVGLDQDSYMRSRAKILLTAYSILASEGISADSEEYLKTQSDFLAYYGFADDAEAMENGMTQLELDYSVSYNLALNKLKELAK